KGSWEMNDYGREASRRARNEKAKRAREQFLMLVLLLALVPTILCIILFTKQSKLQKDMAELKQELKKYELQANSNGTGNGNQGGVGIANATPFPTPESNNTPQPTNGTIPADGTSHKTGGDLSQEGSVVPATDVTPGTDLGNVTKPSPTPTPTPTPTVTPEPTMALDPETGEPLPWADKKVYITFDDGPSKNTDELLDLLNQYNAKATFFVIGHEGEESKRLYKRIVDEGHAIGMHSYSHDYEKIYKSVEDFEKDFTKISNLLYDSIGYVPDLYRFPGGSSNSRCKALTIQPFISFLLERDLRYFDWNVENGDATGKSYTVEELAQNLLDGVEKNRVSVVLCHDTNAKGKTLESMKIVLPTLVEKGAQILPITEDTPMIRHVKPAGED
ncbi:MAG: polysaccharide deacetylase, partial [Lachnospiraceae bacterium]|nr:polysaccharide deacetylase [Lachnospiraceae bacterium]